MLDLVKEQEKYKGKHEKKKESYGPSKKTKKEEFEDENSKNNLIESNYLDIQDEEK